MLINTEAATRCSTPAAGTFRMAIAAVSASKARMGVSAYSPLTVDARNAAQGACTAWSPPV